MRKIIGMGETILDILFRNRQPLAAVPGGSSFNSIISVGRTGIPCTFIGHTGRDAVGELTLDFMKENHVDTSHMEIRDTEKSAVSMAFLDGHGDASYLFYKEPPHASCGTSLPMFQENDVLLFGSYYASCMGMRPLVKDVLQHAEESGTLIYYDLNFRKNHRQELDRLMPNILENLRFCNLVRGSSEDFQVIYGTRCTRDIYEQHIRKFCPILIGTDGSGSITVCTEKGTYEFHAPEVSHVVSTIGAGDNFNAGLSCALVWKQITRPMLPSLTHEQWGEIVDIACLFAQETCQSTDNYISETFGEKMKSAYRQSGQ